MTSPLSSEWKGQLQVKTVTSTTRTRSSSMNEKFPCKPFYQSKIAIATVSFWFKTHFDQGTYVDERRKHHLFHLRRRLKLCFLLFLWKSKPDRQRSTASYRAMLSSTESRRLESESSRSWFESDWFWQRSDPISRSNRIRHALMIGHVHRRTFVANRRSSFHSMKYQSCVSVVIHLTKAIEQSCSP